MGWVQDRLRESHHVCKGRELSSGGVHGVEKVVVLLLHEYHTVLMWSQATYSKVWFH